MKKLMTVVVVLALPALCTSVLANDRPNPQERANTNTSASKDGSINRKTAAANVEAVSFATLCGRGQSVDRARGDLNFKLHLLYSNSSGPTSGIYADYYRANDTDDDVVGNVTYVPFPLTVSAPSITADANKSYSICVTLAATFTK